MGFDLQASKKGHPDWSTGSFSWSWMIGAGVGIPVGTFNGHSPGTFIYMPRPDGLCIQYNDGAKVSAKEAKEMAKIARMLVIKYRQIRIIWDELDAAEQSRRKDAGTYTLPVRDDFVDKMESFAEWAEGSGGFRVW